MEQETLDLIRAGVEAFNRRDLEGMLQSLDPEVELEPLRAVLEGSVYRGHEGVREYLEDMKEDWEDFEIRIAELRELDDDHLLVDARMHARARTSGVEVDAAGAWLCEVHEGKITRIRFYKDTDAALEAAGLKSP